MQKIISIETNSVIEENGGIYLSEEEAIYFGLEDGMSVEAYMDDQIWQATVHKFTSSNGTGLWYVKLGEEKDGLTDEQLKWEQIGFDNGFCLGHSIAQRGIIQEMLRMGFDLETIEKVVDMNDEVRAKCKEVIEKR